MKFLRVALFVFAICFAPAICQGPTDTTTTTTTTTSTTTTTTDSTTTTTTTIPTTTTTTTTSTSTTTTTSEPTTTTTTTTAAPTTTTTTTTAAPTTTTAAPSSDILSFRIPTDDTKPACLRANMSLEFIFTYPADFNGTQFNQTLNVKIPTYDSYDGLCSDKLDSLNVTFRDNWMLYLEYALSDDKLYKLYTINFGYVVDGQLFGNVSSDQLGPKSISLTNLTEFSANLDQSYKCFAQTLINLSPNVSLSFTNYQAQPFLKNSTAGFDTAVECPADTTGANKLVPIIVGSALAVLVVLVLIAYIIGRRKHRPGYQSV